jgi:hypothetical protein
MNIQEYKRRTITLADAAAVGSHELRTNTYPFQFRRIQHTHKTFLFQIAGSKLRLFVLFRWPCFLLLGESAFYNFHRACPHFLLLYSYQARSNPSFSFRIRTVSNPCAEYVPLESTSPMR